MNIQEFAERYRVRVRRDGCGDDMIPGFQFAKDMPKRVEYRSHVFEGFNDGRLAVCLVFASKKKWTFAKAKLAAAGFEIRQDADSEGTALFNPANEAQARLALAVCRIKAIRIPTTAQQSALQHARTLRRTPLAA